jgi:hypothetical protein
MMNFNTFMIVLGSTAALAIIFHAADLLIKIINSIMSNFKGKQQDVKKEEAKIRTLNNGVRPTAKNFSYRFLKPFDFKNKTINFMPLLINSLVDPRIKQRVTVITFFNNCFTWITLKGDEK